jgi:hypothetical protein
MRTKTLLSISAFIGTLYALGFLITPEVLARIYGIDATPGTILEVRFFGTTLLGLGIIFWLLRDVTDRTVLRGLLTGFAISNAVGVGVSTWGTLAGIMSPVGWSAAAIYALLLIGCFLALGSQR